MYVPLHNFTILQKKSMYKICFNYKSMNGEEVRNTS
jgi:hypothetical protein